ncbi:DUF7019 family protein [Streptomyces uncialis]|uniref:DUF7019 family protein n=1 Tax=Streptomyces uncialis TaxID=1048205 RepID=UPI0037FE2CCD
MPFRCYLCVSDAKAGMLLSQTDPGRARKRASEVGLDLKVVTARRGVESASAARAFVSPKSETFAIPSPVAITSAGSMS